MNYGLMISTMAVFLLLRTVLLWEKIQKTIAIKPEIFLINQLFCGYIILNLIVFNLRISPLAPRS